LKSNRLNLSRLIKKFINITTPPDNWKIPVIVLTGVTVGLFAFLFYISKAPSYLVDSPQTCVNCHVMSPQYATWSHSSHRLAATCNDCHVPHNNIFNTYFFKAKDGLRHATIFTLRAEPQVIFIKDAGKGVVQENCKRCHEYLNERVKLSAMTYSDAQHGKGRLCWDCHREVPHGTVNSLSSVPYAPVPVPQSPVPSWLKKIINQ